LTIAVPHPCTDLGERIHSSKIGAESAVAESSTTLDVAALTRDMVSGDEDAYRKFYAAYCHRLSRYLLVVASGDEDAARDALQATFVRVVRHIKVFREESMLWNWLTVLARCALSDRRKKHRRYFAFLDRFTSHAQTETQAVNDGEADAHLLTLLENGLHKLSPDERQLVEQKYFQEQSVRKIADGLRLTEKAVESRLVRARQRLKAIVLNELKNDSPN
jgi:RNA polymerase sigma factor (sigma-70 family)